MANLKLNKPEIKLLLTFLVVGILSRTVFHLGENIEIVTAVSIIAGYFFTNKRVSWIVPFLIISITDIIIGNSIIFLFTWSAFLVTPMLGIVAQKASLNSRVFFKILYLQFTGILSTLFFYLWTNFGVVLTTNMYAKTFDGLVQSYINALPFLRPQLIGTFIFIPIVFMAVSVLSKFNEHPAEKPQY